MEKNEIKEQVIELAKNDDDFKEQIATNNNILQENEESLNNEEIDPSIGNYELRASSTQLSPQEAENYLQHNNYEGQRNLKNDKINQLTDKIINGGWHTGNVAICYLTDGSAFLVNGQHVCHSAIKANSTITIMLHEYYNVENIDTVSYIYNQYDVNIERTLQDLAKSQSSALGMNWNARFSKIVMAVSDAYLNPNKELRSRSYKSTKPLYLKKKIEHSKLAAKILLNNDGNFAEETEHLIAQGVIYAMFRSFDINIDDAIKFWTSVRDGEDLKKGTPIYTLRSELIKKDPEERKTILRQFSKCARAWNAFRQGKCPKHLSVPGRNQKLPEMI